MKRYLSSLDADELIGATSCGSPDAMNLGFAGIRVAGRWQTPLAACHFPLRYRHFGGLATFGLFGLFLGPLIMAALLTVWREWIYRPVPQ